MIFSQSGIWHEWEVLCLFILYWILYGITQHPPKGNLAKGLVELGVLALFSALTYYYNKQTKDPFQKDGLRIMVLVIYILGPIVMMIKFG